MSDQGKLPPVEPDGFISQLEAEEPHAESIMLAGVTKMIVPTIMQCGHGGYMVTIPGVGLKAASTLEEVMDFIQANATKHFAPGRVSPFPKMLERVQKISEKAADAVRRADHTTGMLLAFAVLVGAMWVTWDANNGRQRSIITGEYPSRAAASEGSPVRGDSKGYTRTRSAWEDVLPEVHVLGVRTTPFYGGAERPVQDGTLRRMWGSY